MLELPVAGYFRVSVAREGMVAPEIYEGEIARYCAFKQLAWAENFSDIDRSGWKGSRTRPGLNALVARRHEFSAVIVPKLSRFGRSLVHLVELFDMFDRDGIALVFLDLGLDTSTSQGRLLRNVMASFAEYESEVRADYGRSSARLRSSQGQPSGPPPIGYRKVPKSFAIVEEEAIVVRAMFKWYVAGVSLNNITRRMRATGTRAKRGGQWCRTSIMLLLENPSYAGLVRHEGSFKKGNWVPIIDAQTWDLAMAKRAENQEKYARPRGPNSPPGRKVHLLTSMITCPVCGRFFHRMGKNGPRSQYVCTTDLVRCTGGGIVCHRAEEQVVSAYLERYGDNYVRQSLSGPSVRVRDVWEAADIYGKRKMLRASITCISLPARSPTNPKRQGQQRGRMLTMSWADATPQESPPIIAVPIHTRPEQAFCEKPKRPESWSEYRARMIEERARDKKRAGSGLPL